MQLDQVIDASLLPWQNQARQLFKERVGFRVTNPSDDALNDLIDLSIEFRYTLTKQLPHRDEFLLVPK